MKRILAAALPALVFSARDAIGQPVRTDSAGIEILTNAPSRVRLSLDSTAGMSVVLHAEGTSRSRAISATSLPDGGVLVISSGARRFNANGVDVSDQDQNGHVLSAKWVRWVGVDSLFAYDWTAPPSRIVLMSSTGRILEWQEIPQTEIGGLDAAGVLRDRTALVPHRNVPYERTAPTFRQPEALMRYAPGDSPPQRVMQVLFGDAIRLEFFDRSGQVSWVPRTSVAFARNSLVRGRDSSIYVTDGGSYEIREFAPDGKLRRIIRSTRALRRVTQADRDAFLRSGERWAPERLAAGRDTVPAFRRMETGADGTIWVEEFPDNDRSRRWIAYGPDGIERGTLEIPAALEVLDFASAKVVAAQPGPGGAVRLRTFGLIGPR